MARNLDISYLESALNAIGWVKPIIMNQVTSTNDVLLEHFEQVSPSRGLVVIANEQTAGRGRLDRSWSTPAGSGIAISIGAHISDFDTEPNSIPLLTGIAVQRVLAKHQIPVHLKWPNDIIFSKPKTRKLGGILIQLIGERLILGIGLNVDLTSAELPIPTATSLRIEGYNVSRSELITEIVAELDILRTNNSNWLSEYKEVCATLGQKVQVFISNGKELNGLAIDVDETGALLVESLGKIYQITVGDIEHFEVVAD